MVRLRKTSSFLKEISKEWEENPIVERLEDSYPEKKTTSEHIQKLQRILVQTCIDYINENGLTDIYGVNFRADDLNTSAQYGEWTPATDSYIGVEGIAYEQHKRKNGELFKMPFRYDIGEWM